MVVDREKNLTNAAGGRFSCSIRTVEKWPDARRGGFLTSEATLDGS